MGIFSIRKKQLKGVLTIEAAIIMLFTISAVFFVIYMGFYLYDRCVMSGGAYEIAVEQGYQKRLGAEGKMITESTKAEKERRLLFYREMKFAQNGEETTETVSLSGERKMTNAFSVELEDTSVMTCVCQKPEQLIRMKLHIMEIKERAK